jgi:4-amino-4-deoxy-L-arabinose transferase-like glycosyltransferase
MDEIKETNRNTIFVKWMREKPIIWVVFLSVILRIVVAVLMGNEVVDLPGIFDQISYHNLAQRVLNSYGFSFGETWWPATQAGEPTAHWSFLYTLYLTGVYKLFGVHPLIARIFQAIIVGVIHPYIIWRIGEKFFNRNIGLIASGITALYAYYIYYGAALMTEPFYITAILFSLYFGLEMAESRNLARDIKLGLAMGICIGITIALRQVFLLFVPFLFLWIWITRLKNTRNLPIVSTIISFALIVLFILPISVYNQNRFGRFVLLNTNSGYAFFWGNHPIHGTEFIPILPSETYQRLIPPDIRQLDEAALDQELLSRGIQFVVDDPKRYILLSLSRIPAYFMFWPSADSNLISNVSRLASFGLMLPFMIYGLMLGIRGALRENGGRVLGLIASPIGLLILFVVVYSAIHIFTWALIRYRLPVDAVLVPFAGLALSDVARRFSIKA